MINPLTISRPAAPQYFGRHNSDARITPEGRLVPSPGTRVVTCAADAARYDLDILVIDNLLQPEDCSALVSLYNANLHRRDPVSNGDKEWQNRILWFAEVAKADAMAANIMIAALRAALPIVQKHWAAPPLYPDTLHLINWHAGRYMLPHADAFLNDGRPRLDVPYRTHSGLLYLNDDFVGGGLYLTELDVLIRPAQGMFVSTTAGLPHMHAVIRVERGMRYVMPTFFTPERARGTPDLIRRLGL